MDLSKFRPLYHQEALKLVALAQSNLGELGFDPSGALTAGHQRLYRAIHTLKGQSATMQDEPIYHLAQVMEDLLDGIGKGQYSCDEATRAFVAESVGRLSEMVTAVAQGAEPEPAPDLVQALRMHMRRAGTTAFHLVDAPATEEVEAEPEVASSADDALSAIAELMGIAQRLRGYAQSEVRFGGDAARLEAATRRIYGVLARIRQLSFDTLLPPIRRHLHVVSRQEGREARLEVTGTEALADPTVLGALQGALVQLVNNAVVHGVEAPEVRRKRGKPRVGLLRLVVEREGDTLIVELSDDGGGFDAERLAVAVGRPEDERTEQDVHRPRSKAAARQLEEVTAQRAILDAMTDGVSTHMGVNYFAGRGQGLGAVRDAVERVGGTLQVETRRGQGSTFRIVVPVQQRFEELLLVDEGGTTRAFPTRLVAASGECTVNLRNGTTRRVDRVLGAVEGLVSPPPFPFNLLAQVNGTTVGADGTILFVMDPEAPSTHLASPGAPP